VSLVVYACLSAGETALDRFINPVNSWPRLIGAIGFFGFDLLGLTFLAGFLSRSVGIAEHGLPDLTLGGVLRSQPYGKLICADLLVTLCFIIGVVALIVPGFVVFTYFALAGPVIKFEHRTVLGSVRRSCRLVRHHFSMVFTLVTIPFVFGSAVASAIEGLVTSPFLASFAVRVVAEGAVAASCGLVLSEVGYRLLATARVKEDATGP